MIPWESLSLSRNDWNLTETQLANTACRKETSLCWLFTIDEWLPCNAWLDFCCFHGWLLRPMRKVTRAEALVAVAGIRRPGIRRFGARVHSLGRVGLRPWDAVVGILVPTRIRARSLERDREERWEPTARVVRKPRHVRNVGLCRSWQGEIYPTPADQREVVADRVEAVDRIRARRRMERIPLSWRVG